MAGFRLKYPPRSPRLRVRQMILQTSDFLCVQNGDFRQLAVNWSESWSWESRETAQTSGIRPPTRSALESAPIVPCRSIIVRQVP